MVCSALFPALLDSTVIGLALPTVQRDPGAEVTGLQWIVDGCTLLYAALLLTGAAHGAPVPNGPGRKALAVGIERGLLLAGACYLAAAVPAASLIRPERTGARRPTGGRQTVQR
ncbi:hypothetical protein SUDANB106_00273 [Streptomyces sp. enrichment culture]|uniref:hypothetical protein n=1 Tax=Streptomyces sp. enrichment culture TaxID=1795815 RepID=UPI003F575AF2